MDTARNTIRRHPALYGVAARLGWADRAQAELRRWAARQAARPVNFLQIGSNDGVTSDPIHDLVVRYGWRGVLVEPVPGIFERLERNYANTIGIKLANIAIGKEEGNCVFYTVSEKLPGDPAWTDQIGSFDRRHVLRHVNAIPNLEQRIVPINVRVETLASVLQSVATVDVLHVDAEGSDGMILRQVPLEGPHCPRAILFEHRHLDSEVRAEIEQRFPEYKSTVGHRDTLLLR